MPELARAGAIWKKALGLSRSDAKLGSFGMQMQEANSTPSGRWKVNQA